MYRMYTMYVPTPLRRFQGKVAGRVNFPPSRESFPSALREALGIGNLIQHPIHAV